MKFIGKEITEAAKYRAIVEEISSEKKEGLTSSISTFFFDRFDSFDLFCVKNLSIKNCCVGSRNELIYFTLIPVRKIIYTTFRFTNGFQEWIKFVNRGFDCIYCANITIHIK